MNDLLKKLNILIQAGINDVLDDTQKSLAEPFKKIPRTRLGQGIEDEVDQLRRKVNDALAYEDELNERIAKLEQEAATLDRQADEAVANNNDAQARYLIDRLTRAQQRITMTQSDLQAHRMATQELMMRVNQLDAAIADAKFAEEQSPTKQPPADDVVQPPAQAAKAPPKPTSQPKEPKVTRVPVSVEADEPPDQDKDTLPTTAEGVVKRMQSFNTEANKVLSDVLREAREKIEQMDELIDASEDVQQRVNTDVIEEVAQELSQDSVDKDIDARRARLTKPPTSTDDPKSKPHTE